MNSADSVSAEQELAELSERFRALTTLAFDGVAIMEDGVFLEVDAKCAESLGYDDPSELIGIRIQDVLTPASWKIVKDKFRIGSDLPSEIVAVGRDGSPLPTVTYGLNVPYRGRIVRLMAARGICDQVALERQVIEASNHEQARIGRDLHDGLGQTLTGLALSVALLKKKLATSDSPYVDEIGAIQDALSDAVEECRQFSHTLAPVLERIRGMSDALKGLAENMASLSGIECHYHSRSGDVEFDLTVATHLYRIAQEAVNNAAKHSQASRIDIVCSRDEDKFYLTIADNGRGIPSADDRKEGIGIATMYYRARMIEGTLDITPRQSGGTQVVCCCPLPLATARHTKRVVALDGRQMSKQGLQVSDYRVEVGPYTRVIFSGEQNGDSLRKALGELADSILFEPQQSFIADFTLAALSLDPDDLVTLPNCLAACEKLRDHSMAIVFPEDYSTSVAQLFGAYGKNWGRHFGIFQYREDAETWLREKNDGGEAPEPLLSENH